MSSRGLIRKGGEDRRARRRIVVRRKIQFELILGGLVESRLVDYGAIHDDGFFENVGNVLDGEAIRPGRVLADIHLTAFGSVGRRL